MIRKWLFILLYFVVLPNYLWAYDWPIDHNGDSRIDDGIASNYKITETLGADRCRKARDDNGKNNFKKRYHTGVDISTPAGSLDKKVYAIEGGFFRRRNVGEDIEYVEIKAEREMTSSSGRRFIYYHIASVWALGDGGNLVT